MYDSWVFVQGRVRQIAQDVESDQKIARFASEIWKNVSNPQLLSFLGVRIFVAKKTKGKKLAKMYVFNLDPSTTGPITKRLNRLSSNFIDLSPHKLRLWFKQQTQNSALDDYKAFMYHVKLRRFRQMQKQSESFLAHISQHLTKDDQHIFRTIIHEMTAHYTGTAYSEINFFLQIGAQRLQDLTSHRAIPDNISVDILGDPTTAMAALTLAWLASNSGGHHHEGEILYRGFTETETPPSDFVSDPRAGWIRSARKQLFPGSIFSFPHLTSSSLDLDHARKFSRNKQKRILQFNLPPHFPYWAIPADDATTGEYEMEVLLAPCFDYVAQKAIEDGDQITYHVKPIHLRSRQKQMSPPEFCDFILRWANSKPVPELDRFKPCSTTIASKQSKNQNPSKNNKLIRKIRSV
jgi:hypothetical protein